MSRKSPRDLAWLFEKLNLGVFTVIALSLSYSAFYFRPTIGDGSFWFFAIFNSRNFFWDRNLIRAISSVLQFPALVYLKLFPQSVEPAAYILSFSFQWHPLVSLIACYLILKKAGRLELFFFPLSGFALCALNLMPYASLVVPETLSLFWPLFLLLTTNRLHRFTLGAVTFLLFIFAFGYESGVILVPLFWLAILKNLHLLGRKKIFLFLLSSLVFLFYIYRLQTAPDFSKGHFADAIFSGLFFGFRLHNLLAMVLFLTFLICLHFTQSRMGTYLVAALSAVNSAFFIFLCSSNIERKSLLNTVWASRTTAIPFAFIIGIGFLYFYLQDHPRFKSHKAALSFYVFSILALGMVHDISIGMEWRKTYLTMQELFKLRPGCNELSTNAYNAYFRGVAEPGKIWLPFHSLNPQFDHEAKQIYFVQTNANGSACRIENDHLTFDDGISKLYARNHGHIEIEGMLKLPYYVHDLNPLTGKIEITKFER